MRYARAVTGDLQPGATFGRYRIDALLGEGGMGRVFRAHDTVLRRTIALKLVADDAKNDSVARLLREERAAAALHHPNAVTVWDAGEIDGVPYIAMELAEGVLLREKMRDSSVTLGRRLRWLEQIARALDAAHRVGLVHRDVKPENIIIGADDTVKVLDFGIAKRATDDPDVASPPASRPAPASFRTAQGHVVGTPLYMAPEQVRGDPLDGRTDQFAWGLVAYELIAGTHPMREGSLEAPPPLLSEVVPGISFELSALIARALARKPELRHPSMAWLADVMAKHANETADLVLPREDRAAPSEGTREPAGESTTGVSSMTAPERPVKLAEVPTTPSTPIRTSPAITVVAVVVVGAGAWFGASHLARSTNGTEATATTDAANALASSGASSIPPSSLSASEDAASTISSPLSATALASASASASASAPRAKVSTKCRCIDQTTRTLCPKGALSPAKFCFCVGSSARLCSNPGTFCEANDHAGAKAGNQCYGYPLGSKADAPRAAGIILSCNHDCANFEFVGVAGAACSGWTLDGTFYNGTTVCP